MVDDVFGNYMASNDEIAAYKKKSDANDKKRAAIDRAFVWFLVAYGFTLYVVFKLDMKTLLSEITVAAVFGFLAIKELKNAFLPHLLPKSYSLSELWALILKDKQK